MWESLLTSGWAMPEGQATQAGDRWERITHTPGFQAKIVPKVTDAQVEGVCSQHCQLGCVSLAFPPSFPCVTLRMEEEKYWALRTQNQTGYFLTLPLSPSAVLVWINFLTYEIGLMNNNSLGVIVRIESNKEWATWIQKQARWWARLASRDYFNMTPSLRENLITSETILALKCDMMWCSPQNGKKKEPIST